MVLINAAIRQRRFDATVEIGRRSALTKAAPKAAEGLARPNDNCAAQKCLQQPRKHRPGTASSYESPFTSSRQAVCEKSGLAQPDMRQYNWGSPSAAKRP